MPEIQWFIRPFDALSLRELYALMQLRVDVFVVEQSCSYAELDGHDMSSTTLHISGTLDNQLIAYARALAPALAPTTSHGTTSAVRIGRVVVRRDQRGQGVALQMLQRLMADIDTHWPAADIGLSAQVTATSTYAALGFTAVSDEYIEDGIAHIEMLKRRSLTPR